MDGQPFGDGTLRRKSVDTKGRTGSRRAISSARATWGKLAGSAAFTARFARAALTAAGRRRILPPTGPRIPKRATAAIAAALVMLVVPSAVADPPQAMDYHCGNIKLDLGTWHAKQDVAAENPISTQGTAQCVASATSQNTATPTFNVNLAFTGNLACTPTTNRQPGLGTVTWTGQLTLTPDASTGYSPVTTSAVISGGDPIRGTSTNGTLTTDAGHSGPVAISTSPGSGPIFGTIDTICDHINDINAAVSNGAAASSYGPIDVVGQLAQAGDNAVIAGDNALQPTTGPVHEQAGNAVGTTADPAAEPAYTTALPAASGADDTVRTAADNATQVHPALAQAAAGVRRHRSAWRWCAGGPICRTDPDNTSIQYYVPRSYFATYGTDQKGKTVACEMSVYNGQGAIFWDKVTYGKGRCSIGFSSKTINYTEVRTQYGAVPGEGVGILSYWCSKRGYC